MKVLVTGANGFLATNTIIELLNRGYFVKGLVRNKNNFAYSAHPNLELVEGDITNINDIENAVRGCDFVIHAAANTNQSLLKYRDYQNVNVNGTVNVLEASIKNKVNKIVYVSSANVFGYGTKNHLGDEYQKIKKPFSKSFYALSKLEGQKMALSASKKIDVVVVNPTFMLGAYDTKPSSGKTIIMGLNKHILFYPPGGKNFIHVNDAAKGIVSALVKGKNGEAYLLASENLSYKEFFQKLTSRINRNTILIKLPKILILTIGLIGSLIRKFGIKTNLSMTNMSILCINNFYSNKKAKIELGITFRPIEEAIDDAISWFKNNDTIDKILKKQSR